MDRFDYLCYPLFEQAKSRYVQEIQAMMYTCGDVRNVLSESAELVEDIVHGQIVELVLKAAILAQRRGSKSISPEDLMFIIRHDGAKLKRLKEFLNWRDIRKNVKQTEDTTVANVTAALPFEIGEVVEEEAAAEEDASTASGGMVKASATGAATGGTPTVASGGSQTISTSSKKRANFFWDSLSSVMADLTDGAIRDWNPLDTDLESNQVKEEAIRRLREADALTKNMSKAEYIEYTECRQASFTYKKAKKFRDWLGIPLSVTDYRLSDEVLEIIGFMASELVRRVTEGALQILQQETSAMNLADSGIPDDDSLQEMGGLFRAPTQKTPILLQHIRAFVAQQTAKGKKLTLF